MLKQDTIFFLFISEYLSNVKWTNCDHSAMTERREAVQSSCIKASGSGAIIFIKNAVPTVSLQHAKYVASPQSELLFFLTMMDAFLPEKRTLCSPSLPQH